MKIGICTLPGSPDDESVWSGTPAYFVRALRRAGHDPALVGPLLHPLYSTLKFVSNATGRLGPKLNWEVEPAALRAFTRAARRRLAGVDVAIFMGWLPWGWRSSDTPAIYWTDGTMAQRIDNAPHWSGLSPRSRRQVATVEAGALRTMRTTWFASEWARTDAIDRYSLAGRTEVVGFGANLDDPVATPRTSPSASPKLLLVGVKWQRKGVDRAVLAVDELRRAGVLASLDVVGVTPPEAGWTRDYVTYHGFLDKRRTESAAHLDSLFRGADVFLLPTRDEPFGIVLDEAAAHAVPVVAADVGGVSDHVGIGGVLLPQDATPQDYARAITRVLEPGVYRQLSAGARADYERRLSWDARAAQALTLLT